MRMDNKWLHIFIIVLIITISLTIKLRDLSLLWGQENTITTHDGFRFARYTEEVKNQTYGKIDYLADYPYGVVNQYPPPMISFVTLFFSQLTGITLNNAYLLLPCVLSVLFVIPFYLWTKTFSNLFVFVGGALTGTFNIVYFLRTSPGYFDTDSLMLFFIFLIIYLFSGAIHNKHEDKMSFIYIILSGVCMCIFKWWYDHIVFLLILLFSLFLGLLINKHKHIFLKTFLFMAFLNPFYVVYELISSPFISDYIYGTVFGIDKFKMNINIIYPVISELQRVSYYGFVELTTANEPLLWISLLGLIFLFIKNITHMAIALPICLLGLLSFYMGIRYLMFFGPFLGMGFGYLLSFTVSMISKKYPLRKGFSQVVSCLSFFFLLNPSALMHEEIKPLLSNNFYYSLKNSSVNIEKDSIYFTWWDLGNAVQYITGKPTLLDNTNFHPYKTYLTARAFMVTDEQKTRNIINFMIDTRQAEFMNYGDNIYKIARSAEDFSTKSSKTNIYILIYETMLFKNSMLGAGILEPKVVEEIPEQVILKRNCEVKKINLFNCEGIFTYDVARKEYKFTKQETEDNFKKISFINRENREKKDIILNNSSKRILQIVYSRDKSLSFYIIGDYFERTIMNRMFTQVDYFDNFELIHDGFPKMVLYKLTQ